MQQLAVLSQDVCSRGLGNVQRYLRLARPQKVFTCLIMSFDLGCPGENAICLEVLRGRSRKREWKLEELFRPCNFATYLYDVNESHITSALLPFLSSLTTRVGNTLLRESLPRVGVMLRGLNERLKAKLSRIENMKRPVVMNRDMGFIGEMIAVTFCVVILLFRPEPSHCVFASSAGGFFSFFPRRLLYCRCQVWIGECLSESHLHGSSFFSCFHLFSRCSDQITERVCCGACKPHLASQRQSTTLRR
jgi:hypothetical protein